MIHNIQTAGLVLAALALSLPYQLVRSEASINDQLKADRLAPFAFPASEAPPAAAAAGNGTKTCPGLTQVKPTVETGKLLLGNCAYAELGAFLKTNDGSFYALEKPTVAVNSSCPSAQSNFTKFIINYNDCAWLDLEIEQNDATGSYVRAVSIVYQVGSNASAKTSLTKGDTQLFAVKSKDHYYRCMSEQPIALGGAKDNSTLFLVNFGLEANHANNKSAFVLTPESCPLDVNAPQSDWVTLAVGVCLVGLVAIVMVAYFVGRNRWYPRSSYESV